MNVLWQDIRYGIRMLAKKPGFTLVAVLTLTLGIGANTAMFSVVNGVLLNPLPFPHPDQLVVLYESKVHFENGAISYPNFLDWQKDNRSFESMAGFRSAEVSITGSGESERVTAQMLSADFFGILGVKPLMGRTFTPDEDRLGASPVALISEGFWHRKFGSVPDMVGRTILLDGTGYSVIGIVPASFHLGVANFRNSDVYLPLGQWNFGLFRDRATVFGMDALGRLKTGVTLEHARADMNGIASQLGAAYPQADKGIGATLVPLKQDIVREVKPLLVLLLGAVGFVLLIACANVANLLLARSMGRTREFAIRAAMGASSSRIIGQLLTEGILLAIAGAALGLTLASWGVQGALKLALTLHPEGIPRAEEIGIDWRVLSFTIAITFLVGILFGLAPAWKTKKADLRETLSEGARGATAARSGTQRVLVATELAMAVILLVGAGLMIRSLTRLWSVNPGFNPENVVTFYLSLAPSMQRSNPDTIRADFNQVVETIAAVPGVESVALLNGSLPMHGDSEDPFWIEGQPKPGSDNDKPWALWYEVDPNYLKVMGIPLLRGRFFSESDNTHSPHVAVIDEAFAAKYFPNQDPIGKRIVDDYVGPTEVVGIVGHVKHWGLDDKIAIHAQMYFPFAQVRDNAMPNVAKGVAVVVCSQGAPARTIASIRAGVTQLNGEQVISDALTMNEVISTSLADRRFLMILLIVFAVAALLLASVGIYGVLSYLVGQRIPEMGIRMAFGAQQSDILRLILGEGMRMVIIGLATGLMGALGLTSLMAKLLYGVSASDPATFASVAAVLTAVAVAACYAPARRAMGVEPMVALRHE
jgi:predicted permease